MCFILFKSAIMLEIKVIRRPHHICGAGWWTELCTVYLSVCCLSGLQLAICNMSPSHDDAASYIFSDRHRRRIFDYKRKVLFICDRTVQ